MVDVELLVHLRIPDVVALTTRNTLERRMGYGEALADFRRADYWRLTLDVDSPEAALELARDMAENTNLFVNPNKHSYTVAVVPRELRVAAATGESAEAGAGPFEVRVLVTSPDDSGGEAACQALQGRLGYGTQAAEVHKGTLWMLSINAGDAQEARRIAEELTITRRIDQGLLLNPHYQECEIWTV
jgi:phosphoribosylformylglycinamidine (FGAM) synthase PurS component